MNSPDLVPQPDLVDPPDPGHPGANAAGERAFLTASPITSAPDLPVVSGVAEARALTQNLLVHAYWLGAYGVSDTRPDERELRTVAAILGTAGAPLDAPRTPAQKVQVTCRDFTVVYVALLRAAGIPARARAGFADYFRPGHWEDHWVAERWDTDGDTARWVRDDAQIDAVQSAALHLDFDPHDQPAGRFRTGGELWAEVRAGRVDPNTCGIGDMSGAWFVAGNVMRDIAALAGAETLPWDSWGAMPDDDAGIDVPWIDSLAALAAADDHDALLATYRADDRLRVPATVTSFVGGQAVQVPSRV